MKHCNSCETTKQESEFHIRKASKDGLSAKCKSCAKAYDESRLRDPKRVEARKAYAKTEAGLIAGSRAKAEWAKRNPKKNKASNAVSNAVRDGKMARKPCEVCGSTYRIHGHHDDYDKMYDVRWLCAQHHRDWHKEHGEALNAI
jgi:hypothetical protein